MKLPFPASMRMQTIAIIVVAFVLSNLAGYLLYHADKESAVEMTEVFEIAERAAGVSRLLRDLPPEWGREVAVASDSRGFRVWVSPTAPFDVAEPSAEEADIETYMRSLLPRISSADMRVRLGSAAELDAERLAIPGGPAVPRPAERTGGERVAIAILHPDGAWLSFLGTVNTPESAQRQFLTISMLSAAAVIAFVALWLVHRVTGPLDRLAAAAERLGKDIHAAPLEETGPTEVAKAAAAFNRMQRRLVRLVADRTRQLAAISHDLRTPITQLRLRTELQSPTVENRKNLDALDTMEATINTFLEFARAVSDPEERSRIDLGALIESICSDYSDTGADVAYDCENGLVLSCKRLALRRAVSNLVDNALKYGVRARVSASRVNGEIRIQVEDDGPGIPADQIDLVFAPFHRADASRSRTNGGVGLGLSITQAIAEDHGGRITLTNRPGGGLTAVLSVPGLD